MHSGELQRRVASNGDWMARLRGRSKGGWSVEEHNSVCNEGPTVTGHGLRGAVVGWCLPVQVVDGGRLDKNGGRVVVMRRSGSGQG